MLRTSQVLHDEAVKKNEAISALIASLRDAKDEPTRGAVEKQLRACVTPGIYEHFKSSPEEQKLYVVYGVVPDVNGTLPPMVHYAALYAPHAGEMVGRVLFDAQDGFFGPINRPEYRGPRFRLVYPLKRHPGLELILAKAEAGRFPTDRAKALEIIEVAFPEVRK